MALDCSPCVPPLQTLHNTRRFVNPSPPPASFGSIWSTTSWMRQPITSSPRSGSAHLASHAVPLEHHSAHFLTDSPGEPGRRRLRRLGRQPVLVMAQVRRVPVALYLPPFLCPQLPNAARVLGLSSARFVEFAVVDYLPQHALADTPGCPPCPSTQPLGNLQCYSLHQRRRESVPDLARSRPVKWCKSASSCCCCLGGCRLREIGLRKSFVEGQNGGCEVSTSDGPFVVLLSRDGANEAAHGRPVREDAHHIGASPDLLVETLLWVVPDFLPVGEWEAGEGQDVGSRFVQ